MFNGLTEYKYNLSYDGRAWDTNTKTLLDNEFETLRSLNGYSLQGTNAVTLKFVSIRPTNVSLEETTATIPTTKSYHLFIKLPTVSDWTAIGRQAMRFDTWQLNGWFDLSPLVHYQTQIGSTQAVSIRSNTETPAQLFSLGGNSLSTQFKFMISDTNLNTFADNISYTVMKFEYIEYVMNKNNNVDGLSTIYFVK